MTPAVAGTAPAASERKPSRRMSSKGPAPDREAFVKEWAPLSLTASSADYYFNSYNHYGVHEDVLKDFVTSSAYIKAVKQNAHLFRGAVVLDACAGLGVCAMLAAQAGAKKVIALESQPELTMMGARVARQNGFGEDVLEYVCGDANTLAALPGGIEQVDIIISEWMGYFLMYESRLCEVLKARDRWLRPGGLMFPDRARLYVALMEDAAHRERHFEYYRNVWGFDYSVMKGPAQSEPVVNGFEAAQLITSPQCVLDLNLRTCTAADCFQMAAAFTLPCRREGKVHAVLAWFEIRFDLCHRPIAFATGPESPQTCWKQTAFFLGGAPVAVKPGDKAHGMIAVRRPAEARRNLDIKIACRVNSGRTQANLYRWS